MKRFLCFILVAVNLFFVLSSCASPSSIRRGSWDGQLYHNAYGEFNLRSNDLFDRYSDKKIKEELGYVYSPNGHVLNDTVISSDYCAIIVTLEDPGKEYSLKDYVNAFITNSRAVNGNGNYSIAETYQQSIAGKTYTCVPILYYESSSTGSIGYCEYTYIRKSDENIFVLIRITSGTQLNIEIALKMFEDPNTQPSSPSEEDGVSAAPSKS